MCNTEVQNRVEEIRPVVIFPFQINSFLPQSHFLRAYFNNDYFYHLYLLLHSQYIYRVFHDLRTLLQEMIS
jgi:hypothetical protein